MISWVLYLLAALWITFLIFALEWDKIRRVEVDLKTVLIVLIVLFFLGSALVPLFT